MFRLYHPAATTLSFRRVGDGIKGALERAGLLAGAVPYDSMQPEAEYDGADAETAILVGPGHQLPHVRRLGIHKEVLFMLAPNSDWLPTGLIQECEEHATGILTPSHWGASIIRQYTDLPVEVYQHGVDAAFVPDAADHGALVEGYKLGRFNVLHMSSTERERKGTKPLVEAWILLVSDGVLGKRPTLTLVLDEWTHGAMKEFVAEKANGNLATIGTIKIVAPLDMDVAFAAKVYRDYHLVAQPSRGEGFGLCGIEALACGVPVLVSDCGGHEEWLTTVAGKSAVVVHLGNMELIDDGPGAMAPALHVDRDANSLYVRMRHAYRQWERYSKEAQERAAIGPSWSWDVVTWRWLNTRAEQRKPVPIIRHVPAMPESPRVTAAIRTWNMASTGRQELLMNTLASVWRQTHKGYHAIVVDNGSDDASSQRSCDGRGFILGAETSGRGKLGRGVNLCVEHALKTTPDIVVVSDDDIEWHHDALQRIADFWRHAPEDVVLLAGLLEPMWDWNKITGVVDAGGQRAVVRETVPGGAWTFRASDWPVIGPVREDALHDTFACRRLRQGQLRMCAMDLADHAGWYKSTHGNAPPVDALPVDKAKWGLL